MRAKTVNDLQSDLLDALRQRGNSDAEIAAMTPAKAFYEYCEWHGLCGYATSLMSVYEAAKRDMPILRAAS